MKRFLIVAIMLLMPQVQNAMEEKKETPQSLENLMADLSLGDEQLTPKDAGDLYWNSGPAFDQGQISYEKYKTDLKKAIPFLDFTQHHYHNPLLNAVFAGDYDFAKFLLEHGASPTFSGMNRMSGYDALSLTNSKIYDNPDAIKRFKSLLDSYLKPGEQIAPYSGGSGNYIPNRALNN